MEKPVDSFAYYNKNVLNLQEITNHTKMRGIRRFPRIGKEVTA